MFFRAEVEPTHGSQKGVMQNHTKPRNEGNTKKGDDLMSVKTKISSFIISLTLSSLLSTQLFAHTQEHKHPGLFSGDRDEIKETLLSLHNNGKDSIPILIKELNNTDVIDVITKNPVSSIFYPTPMTVGELAAFVLELILNKVNIEKDKVYETYNILGPEQENYILPQGRIYKRKKIIKPKHLTKISRHYETWWEQNKHMSLDQLRAHFKLENGPLIGTSYHWE